MTENRKVFTAFSDKLTEDLRVD